MTTSSNGGSASHSLQVGSGNSVDEAMVYNNGVNYATATISGDYSFSDSVSNAEGDTAGVTFNVLHEPNGDPYSHTTGTHTYGSETSSDHVLYWQTASVSSAGDIHAIEQCSNAKGDHASADLEVASRFFIKSPGTANCASISNYWGLAEALGTAAFAAQGFNESIGASWVYSAPYEITLNHGIMVTTSAWNGPSTVTGARMETSRVYKLDSISNYASLAISCNNNAASLLLSGTINGMGDAFTIAYNPGPIGTAGRTGYSTGTYQTMVWSSSNTEGTSSNKLIASPNYNSWPGFAWAGPTATASMLETQSISATSWMDVYAGDSNNKQTPVATVPYDYKGAASTGTSRIQDAIYITRTPL